MVLRCERNNLESWLNLCQLHLRIRFGSFIDDLFLGVRTYSLRSTSYFHPLLAIEARQMHRIIQRMVDELYTGGLEWVTYIQVLITYQHSLTAIHQFSKEPNNIESALPIKSRSWLIQEKQCWLSNEFHAQSNPLALFDAQSSARNYKMSELWLILSKMHLAYLR
jgi:hypothetical protein